MFDWVSAAVGALSSFAISIFAAVFTFQYQNWKTDVHRHVSLFYRTRSQILQNKELLHLARSRSDKKDMLLGKVQFLPCYPFTDFDILDKWIREEFEFYNRTLILALAVDQVEEITNQVEEIADRAKKLSNQTEKMFEDSGARVLCVLDIMLRFWDVDLKKRMMLYFILPSLLQKQSEKLIQDQQKGKDDPSIQK